MIPALPISYTAPNPMMKRASIYERQGRWLVQAMGQVQWGYWLATGPVQALDCDDGPDHLGRAIRRALDDSRPLPNPDNPREFQPSQLLTAARVKSWGSFARLARSIDAELEGNVLALESSRRVRDSFEPDDEPPIELVRGCSDHELGEAAIAALERCT